MSSEEEVKVATTVEAAVGEVVDAPVAELDEQEKLAQLPSVAAVKTEKLKEDESDASNLDVKLPLFKKFKPHYSYTMVALSLINVATLLFSHFSVSAIMRTSICPDKIFDGCPVSVDVGDLRDACTNPTDVVLFEATDPTLTQYPAYMLNIVLACFAEGDSCVIAKLEAQFNMSETCASCYTLGVSCAKDHCANAQAGCLANANGAACKGCLENNACNDLLRNCTGIDFPAPARLLSSDIEISPVGENSQIIIARDLDVVVNGDCFERDSFTNFQPINLTFFKSVRKAYDGGSIGLALLILVFSGVWPYLKNILMMIAWFTPLTQLTRDRILRSLAILGKWSLVDVFTVVLIVDGAIIQKFLGSTGIVLVVYSESRIGIYMFAVGALWALAQGEWIRYLEKTTLRQAIKHQRRVPTWLEERLIRKSRVILGVASGIALALALLGMFTINIAYIMSGKITQFEGPNDFNYTVFELAMNLIDDCVHYDGNDNLAGAYFLAIVFFLVTIIFPLLSMSLMYIVAMTFNHSHQESWLVGIAFGLSNFAALDVFFVSMIVFARQFEGLIAASVGNGVNENCGVNATAAAAGEFCVKLEGSIEAGAWVILAAALVFWIAQYASVKLMNQTFRFTGPYTE